MATRGGAKKWGNEGKHLEINATNEEKEMRGLGYTKKNGKIECRTKK